MQLNPKQLKKIERLAPIVDKDGMVTVYRASAEFPDTLPKDTYVSTKPDSVRYYAESWYKGDPKDIEIRQFKVPASQLKRGGNADNWQLTDEIPMPKSSTFTPSEKPAQKSSVASLAEEAKKYKSAEVKKLGLNPDKIRIS